MASHGPLRGPPRPKLRAVGPGQAAAASRASAIIQTDPTTKLTLPTRKQPNTTNDMFSSTSENKVTTTAQDAEAFLSRPIQSAVQPRWERRQQRARAGSDAGDRFIPNREASCSERQMYAATNAD